MKSHSKLIAGAATVAAVALGVSAQIASADGTVNHAFVCGPGISGDPAVYGANDTNVFSAGGDAYVAGYYAPFAETTVPMANKVGDYYLTCTMPAGSTATGAYILGDGSLVPITAPDIYLPMSIPEPGVYPVVQAPLTPAAPAA